MEIILCEICGYPKELKLNGEWYCFKRHKSAINKRPRYSGKSTFWDFKSKKSFDDVGYAGK